MDLLIGSILFVVFSLSIASLIYITNRGHAREQRIRAEQKERLTATRRVDTKFFHSRSNGWYDEYYLGSNSGHFALVSMSEWLKAEIGAEHTAVWESDTDYIER